KTYTLSLHDALPISGMKIEANKLLTNSEIESVTGEPAKQAVTSGRTEAGFAISQCYFQTAIPAKSVVVTVTSRAPGPEAKEPRQDRKSTRLNSSHSQ